MDRDRQLERWVYIPAVIRLKDEVLTLCVSLKQQPSRLALLVQPEEYDSFYTVYAYGLMVIGGSFILQ